MSKLENDNLTYVQKLEKDYLRIEAENERYKQVLEDLSYSDDAEVVRVVTEALKGESE